MGATVVLTLHHGRAEATALARSVTEWLAEAGHEVRMPVADAAVAGLESRGCPDGLLDGADVAVSLGGDGTMLRTVDLVGASGVPIIGVNLGQLGYLTEVEPTRLHEALESFLAGAYQLEPRMLLEVTVDAPSGGAPATQMLALNEAVLERTLTGHTVRLDVSIDGRYFTPYETDALIVATPTGSTAYAFSARGPIVAPTHRALLLTPVSPHMLFDRTLVLEPGTELRLCVAGHRPAALAIDGRPIGHLAPGDAVVCRGAAQSVQLVVFETRDFPRILKAKFGLNDR